MKNTSTIVVGCSDRQGVTYAAAAANEVSCHPDVVERMLATVLGNLPSNVRQRARARLLKRWNRDWGVDVDHLATGATIATARAV